MTSGRKHSGASPKVSVIGCGNVGTRFAYALAIRRVARQIVLVDADNSRLEGETMDLSHGAPYHAPVEFMAGTYRDIRDSDLVVVTAGKKQKPGQTRLDLARDNVALYREMIPEIMKYAPAAIFLVVTNPVDVLAYAACRFSGKPPGEVIGSGTVLDSARFRFLLARHCAVDPRNVHAYILGEHGDTEFAVWSGAMIGGVRFKEYCPHCGNRRFCDGQAGLRRIFLEVRDSAYKIIERKGETSYGVGLAMVRIAQAIINDENAVLPVSSLAKGVGGGNVYLSLPAVVNKRGVRELLHVRFSAEEQRSLRKSAVALRRVIRHVGL